MKKKLKDLTDEEKERFCERQEGCSSCPLHEDSWGIKWGDAGFCHLDSKEYQEKEIEVDEKELTLLQAMTDLREDAKDHLPYYTEYLNERLDVIETALNDYFVYKQDYERVMKEKNSLLKEYAKSQKKLKALEIIKEKKVAVGLVEDEDYTLKIYNTMVSSKKRQLAQEEYDLLKEVLG